MHFHLTFSGLVCLLSLWEAAGAMSFYDPFEGTENKITSLSLCEGERSLLPGLPARETGARFLLLPGSSLE